MRVIVVCSDGIRREFSFASEEALEAVANSEALDSHKGVERHLFRCLKVEAANSLAALRKKLGYEHG